MNPLMLMPFLQPLMQLAGLKNDPKVQGPPKVLLAVLTGDVVSFMQALSQLSNGGGCPPAGTTQYPCRSNGHQGYADGNGRAEQSETLDALRTLRKHYGKADVAGAFWKNEDGLIGRNDLETLLRDPRTSGELKKAVEHLLQAGIFEEISQRQTTPFGPSEPFITRSGLDDAIERFRETAPTRVSGSQFCEALRDCGASRNRLSASTSESKLKRPESNPIRAILNDPSMSIEEKLRALLMEVMQKLDDDMLKVSEEMADLSAERESLPSGEEARDSELNRSIDKLSIRFQSLGEKRKAMFELLSNMTANFGEMSMRAITNLGQA